MSVSDKDMGFNAITRELVMLNGAEILVGVQSEEESAMLTIAAVNEFGSDPEGPMAGHIPERSFLRATFDEEQAAIEVATNLAIDQVLAGKGGLLALNVVGLKVTNLIKKRIVNRIAPANAESTIKRKKSDKPLIDKGRLINSIRHKVIIAGGVTTSPKGAE
jgi:hypothetical protein